jgi:F0F1-type ATP synthase membrane subunit c/vacuolar-type H+-ATPase subunit K
VTRLVQSDNEGPRVLFLILLPIAIGNIGASFILKHKIFKTAIEQRKPELVRGAYIIALALCESAATFGLVVHIATGVEFYYFFFVLGGFGILLHKPQRNDLLAAYAETGIWEARKND